MILTTLCCIPFVQAQDIITTKDGKDIQSKILEVNANEVKYKKYNNLDGPTFTLSKSEILIVRYENGENEVFQEHNNSVDKKYNTTAEVVVGMRYREYKNLYNTKEYVPQRDDPYSRAWAGNRFIYHSWFGARNSWAMGTWICYYRYQCWFIGLAIIRYVHLR